jgi:hypothetical protein
MKPLIYLFDMEGQIKEGMIYVEGVKPSRVIAIKQGKMEQIGFQLGRYIFVETENETLKLKSLTIDGKPYKTDKRYI